MKISVIIASYNEGLDLEATIMLAAASRPAPYEIIVIDDFSDDPVEIKLSRFPNVKVFRTGERLGSGPAKRLGVEKATGDVFVILDSHMRMPSEWLSFIEDAVLRYPRAIFCACCRGFEMTSQFMACGAHFDINITNFLWATWLPRGDVTAIDICPMIFGACYVIPRSIWEDIGGLNKAFVGWGYEELDLSLRAWLCDYECRRINGLVVPHRFGLSGDQKTNSYRRNGWEVYYNYMTLVHTIFGPKVFKDLVEPFIKPENIMGYDHYMSRLKIIEAEHKDFQSRRKHDLKRLQEKASFRLPTRKEQGASHIAGFAVRPMLGEKHRQAILDAVPMGGSMLEWGCGHSTLMLRQEMDKSQSIISIEHHEDWATRINKAGGNVFHVLQDQNAFGTITEELKNFRLMTELDNPYVSPVIISGYQFDAILVDGIYRNACLRNAAKYLKPNGTIFLHDADRDWYEWGKQGIKWVRVLPACNDYPGPTLAVGKLS